MNNRFKCFLIKIYCKKCGTFLYKYKKEDFGNLVYCFLSNIIENNACKDVSCPECGTKFAEIVVRKGRLAYKMLVDKFYIRSNI